MATDDGRGRALDHPSWLTAAGTFVGYGVVLLVMFAVLFAVPYLLFTTL